MAFFGLVACDIDGDADDATVDLDQDGTDTGDTGEPLTEVYPQRSFERRGLPEPGCDGRGVGAKWAELCYQCICTAEGADCARVACTP